MATSPRIGESATQEDLVENSIEVRVMGIDGEMKCTIAAKLDWKIARVKKELSDAVGSPVPELKLVFNERNLFNDVILGSIWGDSSQVDVTLMRITKEIVTTESAATRIQSIQRAKKAKEEAALKRHVAKVEAEKALRNETAEATLVEEK
mmetsp:Transcript_67522/g.106962  ORF Transcript_67522/g.106962 Transcript_67522/m.106962 type:complete len:150 (-) Transcript_67522:199-648(-)|eukprot:CAMPEP_0169064400 /NCGR_PEP_ID=MMETSP1015-20121227/1813_1 /TAXON_ID=342587 /ORGANISM="Karlodinium micrum, Strain CCMP2283" /LENGTH=149 /DNA_ID=CAMNT_0009122831 /DNA_START=58 /DNA_END=507 /DNA_ORIENTATION=-